MKKWLVIAFLVMALSGLMASEAMAAPSVAVKSGAMAGLIGVEVGIEAFESSKLLLVAGYAGNGFGVSIGSRYYFLPDGWRPFFSDYLGVAEGYDPYYGYVWAFVFAVTGGVEYVTDSGFLFTAEFGVGMSGGYFAPALGVSVGRQF